MFIAPLCAKWMRRPNPGIFAILSCTGFLMHVVPFSWTLRTPSLWNPTTHIW